MNVEGRRCVVPLPCRSQWVKNPVFASCRLAKSSELFSASGTNYAFNPEKLVNIFSCATLPCLLHEYWCHLSKSSTHHQVIAQSTHDIYLALNDNSVLFPSSPACSWFHTTNKIFSHILSFLFLFSPWNPLYTVIWF